MSDPVTNVEIEDVLSSIRRLVSDGDKARTRDPAPVEATEPEGDPEPESVPESSDGSDDRERLVLTPAFLVVDSDTADAPENDATPQDTPQADHEVDSDGDQEEWHEEEWPETAPADAQPQTDEDTLDDTTAPEPFPLTEMVFDDVDKPAAAAPTAEPTDRSGLVATIAELEAAISAGDDDFEPDGSEVMGETIQWPGSVNRDVNTVEEADVSDDTTQEEVEPDLQDDDVTAAFEHRPVSEVAQPVDPVVEQPETEAAVQDQPSAEPAQDTQPDDYADDDLDGLLDAAGAGLNDEALRALVAEVVREELTGPLGERITRNVRKLVRREIYRILSSQEFD